MDNFHVDVTGEGREMLRRVLEIAFDRHRLATGYRVVRFAERNRYYLNDRDPLKSTELENVYNHPELRASHETDLVPVGVGGVQTLVLYWGDINEAAGRVKELPFPLDDVQALEFVDGWLKASDYGQQPDHDGSNGKGWRVFNNDWGRVDEDFRSFVAIQPVWAMYGK